MHKIAPAFLLAGIWLLPALGSWGGTGAGVYPDASGDTLNTSALLNQGIALYARRGEGVQTVQNAAAVFKQVLAVEPSNFEALWRTARCCWWLGEHAPREQRIAWFDEGRAFAEKAEKAAPDRTAGYYWAGACLGRAAQERGVMSSMFAVSGIAGAMEKVLAINPQDGDAQYILGVLYRQAPGWPLSRGDMHKSLAYAQSAVANRPDVILYYVGLAETLAALGRKNEAKALLRKSLELPGPAEYQPEAREDREKARRLLATLE